MSNCLPVTKRLGHGTAQLVFPVFDEDLTVLWDQQKHKAREVIVPVHLRPLLLRSFSFLGLKPISMGEQIWDLRLWF